MMMLRYACGMIPRKLSLVLTGLFAISSALAAPQAATVPVTIRVTDPSGTGVPHAQVRIIPAPDAAEKTETDEKGQLPVALKAGGYAIFVRLAGFKSGIAHLDVVSADLSQADAHAAQTFSIGLEVSATGSPTVSPISTKDGLLVSAYPYHDSMGFSFADLKAMPHITATFHNTHTNAEETYSGVRLADLLAKLGAPLGSELRGQALANYVVATGSDGYQALLALAEVDPSFHPGEVLVADAMNGKRLDEHSGPLKLVVTEDKRPARSVRNLTTIELKLLP